MTSFNITTDDVGVRGLLEKNKIPVVTGAIIPVKASTPLQKSPENLPLRLVPVNRRDSESHSVQRRQEDRRKSDNSVLLETRNQHDRRTKIGRSDDITKNNAVITLHGIDEIV